MRRLIFLLSLVFLSVTAFAFDPPKGLKWGMTYETVRDSLPNTKELKGPDVPKGFRKFIDSKIPENYYRAEIKKLSVLDENAQRSWCIFDDQGGLCCFQYAFTWVNDKSGEASGKARNFCDRLFQNLTAKYGPVLINEIGDKKDYEIPIGIAWRMIWQDVDSSQIRLSIGRTKTNVLIGDLDGYIIFLSYSQKPDIIAKTEKESKDF